MAVENGRIGAGGGGLSTAFFTLPLRAVADSVVNITGEFREQAAAQAGDYAVDFALCNNHLYILMNTITTGGVIVVTGTTIDEVTGIPTPGATENITVDTTAAQYYQSTAKWREITNIDVSALTAPDYDLGVVGYSDFNNNNFTIVGYRVDAFSQGVNPDMRFRIIKVQDDGSSKFSLVDLENLGVDAGNAGNQIIDNLRAGGDDRSVNPAVGSIWPNDSTLVLKQFDFNTYFTAGENLCESATKDEGVIVRVEGEGGGISNVDFINVQIRFTAGA